MSPQRQAAYRLLLYQAMLDIRIWCNHGWEPESDDPEVWRQSHQLARYSGGVAYWLHNLALASAEEFRKFNEDAFWNQMRHFDEPFPEAGLQRCRKIFEDALTQPH